MHAVLTFSALPLLVGALLADVAYARTHEVQWTNFAAWLVAGAALVVGLALLWALLARLVARQGAGAVYLLVLLVTLVLSIVNAGVHAQDAWGAMPAGPVLSAAVLVLAAVASVIGLLAMRRRPA